MAIKDSTQKSDKKCYNRPRMDRHGYVDEVTRKGGMDVTDVPQGTPVDGDITNVAS